jgi:hypothetical protein
MLVINDGTDMTETINIRMTDDKSAALVEVVQASGTAATLHLNAEQLLLVVQKLGEVHARMVLGKEVPALVGETVGAVFNTRWAVQPELIGEATMMSFSHPSFGPVGFTIPIDQVERMIPVLINQVESAKALKASPQ